MTLIPRKPIGATPSRTFAQITGVNAPEHQLDFVQPDMDHDIEKGLCITVALAKNHVDPHARKMYRTACEFFDMVRNLINLEKSPDPEVRAAATAELLKTVHFPEVPEIGFGYTRDGHRGRGVRRGGSLSDRVLLYLRRYRELRETLTVEPDSLVMIPRIATDRVSDVMANIVKRHLIDYTVDRAAYWGFDPRCMQVVKFRNVWDPTAKVLVTIEARVPVDDSGRAILLVPKGIVRSGPALQAGDYFDDQTGGPEPVAGGSKPGSPSVPSGGAAKAPRKSKEDALLDAERSPGKLLTYASTKLKNVKPRREFQ